MSNLQELIKNQQVLELSKLTSTQLTEIQTKLVALKLYPKDKVDGLYGPLTIAGWKAFKESVHQNKPETVGPGSLTLLLNKTTKNIRPSGTLAQRVYQCCLSRDYQLDQREGALNIIGVEGLDIKGNKISDTPDGWNDVIILLEFKGNNPQIKAIYQATTEPGAYYTRNPLNNQGAARLQLGRQKGIWSVGKHRGYEALSQTGPATLVRDKNRNHLRDDKETVEWWRGVNLHTTKTTGWRGSVGRFIGQWSAGCVVIKDPNQFLSFMQAIKGSLQYRQNKGHKFDFTLLWQDWL